MTAQPGWYDDPQDLTQIRFWDGAAWTQQRAPKPELPTPRASRRDLRAQARAASEPARLSKKDARERLTAAEQTIARYQMRAFDDVDAYRAHVEAEIAGKEREFSITSERERDRLAHERRQALEATEAERQALLLTLQQLRDEVETARRDAETEQARALGDVVSTRRQLEAVRAELLSTSDAVELQSVGLFDYEHPAADSTQLATQLEAVRSQIKNAVREKQAVTTTSNFLFNNSAAQGRKFVGDMTKVLLRAYNAEAENAVKATRAGNLHTAQTRLSRAAEQIAKSGEMISLRITDRYHRLRLEELELAARHLQAVQAEKELERERRAELREQKRAEAELQAERDRLDKERSHYLATLAALQSNGDADGAARIQAKLDDVDRAISDVDYRAANVRAGYVYVISNVGAFGRRMVKIGMTRRLEPMDRVNELGDASVPFRFDVHALFFADDAVGVEAMLHQTFAAERVNKVNLRREFFYTTPEAVLEVLKDHKVEVVSYTVEAEAPEYRSSLASTGEDLDTVTDGADPDLVSSFSRQL